MNEQLLELYKSKWEELCLSMKSIIEDSTLKIKPTCPLLLQINEDELKAADIRLMVFGQETNNWCDLFHDDIQPIINNYDNFFNKGECWGYGGQFWNGVNRFFDLLQHKYPNKKIGLVWNNVIKIGKYNEPGMPPDYIYEMERKNFSVIKAELKIIQPTIVLFLTGPNYDGIITDSLDKIEYNKTISSFSNREISRISLPGIPFAFMTYHPNYLWRNNINSYFQTIIDKINIYSSENIYLMTIDELKTELVKIKEQKEKFLVEQLYQPLSALRDKERILE